MILYETDWKNYPGAQIHYGTTNRSWVRLAGVFYKMGIKNCVFHLAIHNPNLIGVDPFDPNLTIEQITAISQECKENPWYALREVIRVPPVAGPDPVPLKANRANISLFWLFFNHITTLLIQPRQTGKSVSTDALMVTLFTLLTVNTDMTLLTKDDNLRVKNITRLKALMDNLPYYLKLKAKSDTNNTEKITVNRLKNVYNSVVPQSSEKGALNVGRGMTNAINHIDEFAFINNIDITLPAMLASAGAARDSAKEIGAPYGNVFTTTSGYLNSRSGKFAFKVYKECLEWTELLFDCTSEEDLLETIKKNNPSGKVQVLLEYNHRQLGYTDEWLKGKIEDAMAEGENAGADFLNKWAEGSEASPIKKELLVIIKDSVKDEAFVQISKYGYIIRWYIPETEVINKLPGRMMILALDTSDAIGKDDIGAVGRDINTGETLAAGTYNETNLITFSEWIASILIENPNIRLIIERKSSGVAITDNLIKLLLANGIDPFRVMFNWVVNDYKLNNRFAEEVVNVPFNRRHPIVYDKYRDKFGYATTGGVGRSSRNMLYGEVFNTSIKYTGSVVRDKTLVNQIASLTVRNNRIDHKAGENDDLVIAWLLGYYFMSKCDNLNFYGIDSHKILSLVHTAIIDEQGGEVAVAKKEYQQQISSSINELIEKVKTETNPIKIQMLTNKIKHLYREVDTEYQNNLNIESILDNIAIEKRKMGYGYMR